MVDRLSMLFSCKCHAASCVAWRPGGTAAAARSVSNLHLTPGAFCDSLLRFQGDIGLTDGPFMAFALSSSGRLLACLSTKGVFKALPDSLGWLR